MCGIFGFISSGNEGPDLATLQYVATITQTRGRHAFGMAWVDKAGTMRTYKRPGPVAGCLSVLNKCLGAKAMIGHCRWATHGTPDDNRNNHPHAAGAGVLVHNGVVSNYEELLDDYSLSPSTECDSEVFGLLMQKKVGSIIAKAEYAIRNVSDSMAILGLWNDPVRLLVVRRGRPLHIGRGKTGLYFASLPMYLPNPKPVTDRTGVVVSLAGGKLVPEESPVTLAGCAYPER